MGRASFDQAILFFERLAKSGSMDFLQSLTKKLDVFVDRAGIDYYTVLSLT